MAEAENKSKHITLTRPEHQSLADIAYNALVNAIINQDFEPGAQLSIDGLAKQLAMSNTPVREALMRANGERLVRQKTNHGFIVANLLTAVELHQMFELRHILEIPALASSEPTHDAILELKSLVERMTKASDGAVYNDYKDYLLLDHQFHRTLVGMSGNSFILKAWEDLHVHLHLSRLYTGIGLFDSRDSLAEHWAIVQTLERGARDEAVKLLSSHIKQVGDRLETFLTQRFPDDNIVGFATKGK
jgi:DNA-binding GntR family transcriptional regulator